MHYKRYKTVLSPKNNMNLFRGCTHGCIYCDSRSKCYQMDHDFEDIEIKEDALQILEDQLRRKRRPAMVGTGAMTDPYLHYEEKLEITKGSLELIEKYGFGVAILTKSDRILRDIPLLQRINQQTKAVVQVTLTTFDNELCRKLEPRVSLTSERVKILQACQQAGIPTVVWLSPILPFINDTVENLMGILEICKATNVVGIVCFGFGMTLREGNREYFYQQLDRHFPGMKQRYQRAFGDQYVCNSPNNQALMKIFREFCNKHKIMSNPDEVFAYMHRFESREEQLTLF